MLQITAKLCFIVRLVGLLVMLITCHVSRTWIQRSYNNVYEKIFAGPPTHSVGASIVLLAGVCRRLSSVVVCNTGAYAT